MNEKSNTRVFVARATLNQSAAGLVFIIKLWGRNGFRDEPDFVVECFACSREEALSIALSHVRSVIVPVNFFMAYWCSEPKVFTEGHPALD